jgi:bifunctional non-homologous end joining protein LigD
VLEIHSWGAKADNIERPDRLVFDLDPDPSVRWPQLVESAVETRDFLENLGLHTFLKTTGGKGLHIVVPIQRRHDWDEVKSFCRAVARALESAHPDRYTSNISKAARRGRVFIDYLRNGRGASAVAAYSTRARENAPVSVPLAWSELETVKSANSFSIKDVIERLKRLRTDPWKDIADVRQSITASMKKNLTQYS